MKTELLDNLAKPYKIYAQVVEPQALDQFYSFMTQAWVTKGALMADVHAGYSLPIGAVIACKDVVSPQAVGYDIGCGMSALPTSFNADLVRKNSESIFNKIYETVPVGFSHNSKKEEWDKASQLDCTPRFREMFEKDGLYQIGSLGGGNHFIEIGVDAQDKVWIIVHSGSRGIGHRTATFYMKEASGDGKAREGNFALDANSEIGKEYIKDLNFCLEFALENRRKIISKVEKTMTVLCQGKGDWEDFINRNHNHAELKDGVWIHRKGATHAEEGMMGVIPGNMRDGSFIVRGKGNSDSLNSSSHGAGRVLGRKEAERTLNVENFEDAMKGITAKVGKDTLDESPFVYKNIFEVMELQKDLVETVHHVKPLINIKG